MTMIAQGQNIFYTVDALFGDLGDVNHSLFARSELDECTELLDADNFTCEDLSSLEVGGTMMLDHDRWLCPSSPYRCRIRKLLPSSVISIFTPVRVDDGVDGLASLANHIADLVRIDA